MASPSTVITGGFGSFGSVNLLPTLGYGQGDVAVVTPPDTDSLEYNYLPQQLHYRTPIQKLHYNYLPQQLHYKVDDDA